MTSNVASATRFESIKSKIKNVLDQDRRVENFEYYNTTPQHKERMKELAELAPELYNNPDITPRSKWFHHPRYRQNSQMPPYHVHFRVEMQETIWYLFRSYTMENSTSINQQNDIRRAYSIFHSSMQGLNGHVQIEEYCCFPTYKSVFPHVDIQFLYSDHASLHHEVQNVLDSFNALPVNGKELLPQECILTLLEVVVAFDELLMSHLGEEEEIVVPMSLTGKEIIF